jgi:amino acid transporter
VGGLSLAPFTVTVVPANGNLIGGIIFAVLSFIGFETAATLGEETQNPHRNIPYAVFGSMIVVGIFYIIMAYVGTVGYGIDHMVSGFANDSAPFDTITRHYGSPLLVVLIDLVGVLSFFSAALAIINGGSRIIYTVGRDGLLPSWAALLHGERRIPIGSIIVLCLFGLVVGLPLGFLMTPINAFAFLGTLDALLIMVIYALVCLASLRFFWRKRHAQFRLVRHGIIPVLGTLFIIAIFSLLIISPGDFPLNLIPYILLIWLMLGGVLLFVLREKFIIHH